jgi:hypothetical protein
VLLIAKFGNSFDVKVKESIAIWELDT